MTFRFRPQVEPLDGRVMPDAAPGDPPPTEPDPAAVAPEPPPPPADPDTGAVAPEPPPPPAEDGEPVAANLDEEGRLEFRRAVLEQEIAGLLKDRATLAVAKEVAANAHVNVKAHLLSAQAEFNDAQTALMTAETALCELDADPQTDKTGNAYLAAVHAADTARIKLAYAQGKVDALEIQQQEASDLREFYTMELQGVDCLFDARKEELGIVIQRLIALGKVI